MVAIEARITGPALGAITGFLCCVLIIVGLLDFEVGLSVMAATVVVTWIILCIYRSLWAFSILFLVFVLAYARLGLPLISVEGPGNRGIVALGDVLWLSLVLTWTAKGVFFAGPIRIRKAYPVTIWIMLPFVLLATILPVIGVLTGDWPYSYAIPGWRTLQWSSFALFAYFLVRQYNTRRVIKHVVAVMVLAAILHMGYGLIQLGYYAGVLDQSWIFLDVIFAAMHVNAWFFYPRLTGLQVNPNSYGMYSALVFLLALAMHLARADAGRRVLWSVAFAAALFGLLFPASRSAYLGIMVAFFLWFLIGMGTRRLAARGLILSTKLIFVGTIGLGALWPVFPEVLRGRLMRFLDVFSGGAQMDVNAQERVEMWQSLWQLYVIDYPFGTWVPTSYAMDSAVDSYYIVTSIQGTPIFTLSWLVFLGAVVNLGWSAWRRSASRQEAAIGLALAGFAGVMAGGGLTLSPMLQPQLVVPLWVLIGVSLAVVDGREKYCYKYFYYTTGPQGRVHHSLQTDEKTS